MSQKIDKSESLNEQSSTDINDDIVPGPTHKRLRHSAEFRQRLIYSVCLCLGIVSLGWVRGGLGPAFIDLQLIAGVGLEKGSGFITTYFVGRIIGSVVGGPLYEKFNKNISLAVSLIIQAVSFAAIPWCFLYELMLAAHFVNGFSGGTADVLITTEAMCLWGRNCKSLIQMLWMVYGLASILSPIATAPYLIEGNWMKTSPNTTNMTYIIPDMETNATNWKESLSMPEKPKSQLYIIYSISAAVILTTCIPFVTFFCKSSIIGHASSQIQNEEQPRDTTDTYRNQTRVKKYSALANSGVFSALSNGLDFSFSAFLTVFCVEYLYWTKSRGALLTSAYFLATLFGRVCGIFITKTVSATKILGTSSVMCLSGYIAFTVTASHHMSYGIWASTCYLGLAFSILYPTFLSWTNRRIIPLTGKMVSYLFCTSFIGPILNPIIISVLAVNFTMISFCYLLIGQCVLMVVILLVMIWNSVQRKKTSHNVSDMTNSKLLVVVQKNEGNQNNDS